MKRIALILAVFATVSSAVADEKDQLTPSVREPELREELLRRMASDQDTRNALIRWEKENGGFKGQVELATLNPAALAIHEKVLLTDSSNTAWMKKVVDKHSWPTPALVGSDGVKAAWLLVQHADKDPDFQQHCLQLMSALPKAEVSQRDVAYLTDRVLIRQGKNQRYGTQFQIIDGKARPLPIEDEANVEKRRIDAGLPPLAENLKSVEQRYGLSEATPSAPLVAQPELSKELLRRQQVDQKARHAAMNWVKEHGGRTGVLDEAKLSVQKKNEYERLKAETAKVDSDNLAWLREVVEVHGWPTVTLVGRPAADAAWLLVQHADRDRKFQRQCLDIMAALPKHEISQSNFAYLMDRVLLAEGKKQVYGTQCEVVDGKLKPQPIEDEANVDKRRAEVGLVPLSQYLDFFERFQNSTDKK